MLGNQVPNQPSYRWVTAASVTSQGLKRGLRPAWAVTEKRLTPDRNHQILRWLATRAGKMGLSCPLGPTRRNNKSFIDQACSVKMAGYWPRSIFFCVCCLWMSITSRSSLLHRGLFRAALACVAGRRKGGKGSKRSRENWEERRRERPARTLLFSSFFTSTRRT